MDGANRLDAAQADQIEQVSVRVIRDGADVVNDDRVVIIGVGDEARHLDMFEKAVARCAHWIDDSLNAAVDHVEAEAEKQYGQQRHCISSSP